MKCYLYILESLKDGNHYVGISYDVKARFSYHNAGKVRSTKGRVPFKLIYTEMHSDRISAREREKFLKSYRGAKEKLTIIEHCGVV